MQSFVIHNIVGDGGRNELQSQLLLVLQTTKALSLKQ